MLRMLGHGPDNVTIQNLRMNRVGSSPNQTHQKGVHGEFYHTLSIGLINKSLNKPTFRSVK